MYIIRSDAGQPLRDELAKSPQEILRNAFPEFAPKSDVAMTPGTSSTPAAILGNEGLVTPIPDTSNPASAPSSATSDAYFQGLALIKTLVKLIPSWLQNNRPVFDTLVLVWKSPARISRLHNEQELNLVQVSLVRFARVIKFLLFCCFVSGRFSYKIFPCPDLRLH